MKVKNKAIYITCLLSTTVLFAGHAKAAVVMTLQQVASNVVGTGSGTIDTTALNFLGPTVDGPKVRPDWALFNVGTAGNAEEYGVTGGPTGFGSSVYTAASTASGDLMGTAGIADAVVVPSNYISRTFLSGDAIWDNTTLAALGVTTGTYTWTWGSGADADSLTLYAGVPAPSSAPEPASLLLIGGGLAALGIFPIRKLQNRESK